MIAPFVQRLSFVPNLREYFCLINFDISPKTAITNRCMLYVYVTTYKSPVVKVFTAQGFTLWGCKGGQSHENNHSLILAHVDAGKTTLTESLLYASGAISEQGASKKGQRGRTPCFWSGSVGLPFKRQSLPSQWHRCKVNIVDTPSHMDFWRGVPLFGCFLDGVSW